MWGGWELDDSTRLTPAGFTRWHHDRDGLHDDHWPAAYVISVPTVSMTTDEIDHLWTINLLDLRQHTSSPWQQMACFIFAPSTNSLLDYRPYTSSLIFRVKYQNRAKFFFFFSFSISNVLPSVDRLLAASDFQISSSYRRLIVKFRIFCEFCRISCCAIQRPSFVL